MHRPRHRPPAERLRDLQPVHLLVQARIRRTGRGVRLVRRAAARPARRQAGLRRVPHHREVPSWDSLVAEAHPTPATPTGRTPTPLVLGPTRLLGRETAETPRHGSVEDRSRSRSFEDLRTPCADCAAYCCSTLVLPKPPPTTNVHLDYWRFCLGFPAVSPPIAGISAVAQRRGVSVATVIRDAIDLGVADVSSKRAADGRGTTRPLVRRSARTPGGADDLGSAGWSGDVPGRRAARRLRCRVASVTVNRGIDALVSADRAFAEVPDLRHVVPDEAGVAVLLGR